MKTSTKKTDKKTFSIPLQDDSIERVDFSENFSKVKAVDINVVGGNLIFLPAESDEVSVRVQWIQDSPESLPKFKVANSKLSITSRGKAGILPFFRQTAAFVIEVKIPHGTQIDVRMTAGTIYLGRVNIGINAYVRFGSIEGIGQFETFNAKMMAGSIKVHGLTGNSNLEVGIGDCEVIIGMLNTGEAVKVKCRLGDVVLKLPSLFDISSFRGTKQFESLSSEGASVSASIGLGDIEITH